MSFSLNGTTRAANTGNNEEGEEGGDPAAAGAAASASANASGGYGVHVVSGSRPSSAESGNNAPGGNALSSSISGGGGNGGTSTPIPSSTKDNNNNNGTTTSRPLRGLTGLSMKSNKNGGINNKPMKKTSMMFTSEAAVAKMTIARSRAVRQTGLQLFEELMQNQGSVTDLEQVSVYVCMYVLYAHSKSNQSDANLYIDGTS
jgi:hypothetical protein